MARMNPYKEILIWLKTELLHLKGVYQALNTRDESYKREHATRKRLGENEGDLENLHEGKKSIK